MNPSKSDRPHNHNDNNNTGHWIDLGRGGAIAADRIVAAARAQSTPIKRLLEAAGPAHVLNLTYGEPRATVLLLDSGHLAVISMPLETFLEKLHGHDSHYDHDGSSGVVAKS